ncbi:Acyl-protein synthetase, LuxE [Catalinimonas alkaloidigena]|uniref:Acyl-protein synthetase, LuxE n=1 Tax=Catalinimonas alkaloidigena TaxID=1075417 RepID=A0A1G9C006_9BACT|nr:acyl transferase [Catalinimonas alkaloidigena]SDK45022.1 Acyl-protein synthetase, LuxE [Catalinimonas alkaloidigena]
MESTNFIKNFKRALPHLTPNAFEEAALALFRFQATHNEVYRRYLGHLRCHSDQVVHLHQIPFLPIEFFKHHRVVSTSVPPEVVFESSGTTGQIRSRHFVADTAFYRTVAETIFQRFYGPLDQYVVLALLPSYLERQNASLVWMVDHFIRQTGHPDSGFYLHQTEELIRTLRRLQGGHRRVLLIGVTFALLDLADEYETDLSDVLVMETGGMKGRRRELLREEVHARLCERFRLPSVHSEYGMTELLSQAYARQDGLYETPAWMRVLLRDERDPFDLSPNRRTGGINIIDLANVDSCAFIESADIGTYVHKNSFRVLGRMDQSDLRGCSLMTI